MGETNKDLVQVYNQQDKERSETSFDDLPDDIIMEIMTALDFASCLKLRVNKRLSRLQLEVKKELDCIDIRICRTGYTLLVYHSNTRSSFESSNFDQLSQGLHRLALNTRVDYIVMWTSVVPNEEHCRIVDAPFNFEANNVFFESGNEDRARWNLQHVNLPSFHAITQNFGSFECDLVCSSVTAQDFCIIRKAMLESGCKLRKFNMIVEEEMEKSFFEACFGVTFDDFAGPIRGRIYRAMDESVEIYSDSPPLSGEEINRFCHLEGNVSTVLLIADSEYNIIFRKLDGYEAKEFAEEIRKRNKVQLNHFYRAQ